MHIKFMCAALLTIFILSCNDDEKKHEEGFDASAPKVESCGAMGVSVACVGPGGCKGGQECGDSGAFEPCVCEKEASSTCGIEGASVACVGPSGCAGAQTCNADGMYGACDCGEEAEMDGGSEDASIAAIRLEITEPEDGATLKGMVVVSGTASSNVQDVRVAIGGDSFVYAAGIENWKATLDTRRFADGPTTLVAVARGAGNQKLSVVISVNVANVDPLVGRWRVTEASSCKWAESESCDVSFFASGLSDNPCRMISYSWRWEREADNLIVISNYDFTWSVVIDMPDVDHLRVKSPDCGQITLTRIAGSDFSPYDAGVRDDEDAGN
jgi:hypothetical protein